MTLPRIDLVVTRHEALVRFLREEGYVSADVRVAAHVSASELEGRNVLGHLPLNLAVHAGTITEPVLEIALADRGRTLSTDEVREAFRGFRTFRVQELPS